MGGGVTPGTPSVRSDQPHFFVESSEVQSHGWKCVALTGGWPLGPQGLEVNIITYSPVGARATVGSWAQTFCATPLRV